MLSQPTTNMKSNYNFIISKYNGVTGN